VVAMWKQILRETPEWRATLGVWMQLGHGLRDRSGTRRRVAEVQGSATGDVGEIMAELREKIKQEEPCSRPRLIQVSGMIGD